MTTQTYAHTCPRCQFKGTIEVDGKTWDVHGCCNDQSILFRYGPEPVDYHCYQVEKFPLKSRQHLPGENHHSIRATVLNAAFQMAREQGFI